MNKAKQLLNVLGEADKKEKKTYRVHFKDAKGRDQSTTVDAESEKEAKDSFDRLFRSATNVEIKLDK